MLFWKRVYEAVFFVDVPNKGSHLPSKTACRWEVVPKRTVVNKLVMFIKNTSICLMTFEDFHDFHDFDDFDDFDAFEDFDDFDALDDFLILMILVLICC